MTRSGRSAAGRRVTRGAALVEYGLAAAVLALVAVAAARCTRLALHVLDHGVDRAATQAGWRF